MTLPTAAPWTVTINHSFRTYKIWDEDGNYHDSDIPEREANRALIEAAPDLLDVLQEIVATIDFERGTPETEDAERLLIATRAAIAKATGAA